MLQAGDVLAYWLEELGEAGWYAGGAALDGAIRDRFGALWQAAFAGELSAWLGNPRGVLAYLIVTDQFPRNIHRDSARAFATDPLAHAAANKAMMAGWDARFAGAERQFFYLPFMHAETIADQNRSVALFSSKMPGETDNLLHARAHREVIRRFGRFPTRNAALGRVNSPTEAAFLAAGGYRAVVRALQD